MSRPLDERVLEVLENNKENAYTEIEVAARVMAGKSDPTTVAVAEMTLMIMSEQDRAEKLGEYREVLAALQKSGRVRTWKDGATVYYAHASDHR